MNSMCGAALVAMLLVFFTDVLSSSPVSVSSFSDPTLNPGILLQPQLPSQTLRPDSLYTINGLNIEPPHLEIVCGDDDGEGETNVHYAGFVVPLLLL